MDSKKLIFAFVFLFLLLFPIEVHAACTENWQCTPTEVTCDWHDGDHVRNCIDLNGCGTTNNKPAEHAFWYKLSAENTPQLSRIVANVTTFSGNGPLTNVLEYYPCASNYTAYTKGTYKFGVCCPNGGGDCRLVYPRVDVVTDKPYNRKILATGETWNLGMSVTLTVNSIDPKADPRQTWFTLSMDGVKKDDKVVASGQYYDYIEKSMCGESDVPMFGTYVDSIFPGAISDMVQLQYTYVNKYWWSCTENWECGNWGYCIPGVDPQQTRDCVDIYTCGTTVSKPSISRPCCAENWQCGNWSVCIDEQQVRNCIESNNCDTVYDKPVITQKCTSCIENWQCGEWSACLNDQQTRICIDSNSCGTTISKPAITQICNSICTEVWKCGEWSACIDNQQTRECVDLTNCGTTTSKPAIIQECTISCTENWQCGDWSNCTENQQTRECTDLNSCGTVDAEPLTIQSCVVEPLECTESWFCSEWSVCNNNQQTRECLDSNSCGTIISKPTLTQECGINADGIIPEVQEQTDELLTQNDQTCTPFAVIFGLLIITIIWKK